MEELKFEKLLFNTAICVMACDGEIHDREIQELKLIAKNTPYFKDLDYQTELDTIMKKIKNNTNIMKQYFEEIKAVELSPVQELLILEVVLRMMYADNRIDENEVKLIRIIKSYLKIPDQIIFERFGKIDFLIKGYDEIDQQASSDNFPKIEFTEINKQLK
jgi:uncharacterized tellurite resistance protein B-like protein